MRTNKLQREMETFRFMYEGAYDVERALSELNEVCMRLSSSDLEESDVQEIKDKSSAILGLCNSLVTLYDLANEYLEN